MTRLLIDVGNTRIKWRAVDPVAGWRDDDAHGAVDLDARAALAAQWAGLGIRSAVTACVAGEAVQIFGGAGYLRGAKVERIFRETKVLSIGGGASEVMKDLAAKQLGY